MFREGKSQEDEIKAWQFWHQRQHSVSNLLVLVIPLSFFLVILDKEAIKILFKNQKTTFLGLMRLN